MADPRGGARLAYTVEEAAGLLSVSRAHVYRLLDLGELASVRIGRSRRVTARQLDAFVRRLEAEAPTRRNLLG